MDLYQTTRSRINSEAYMDTVMGPLKNSNQGVGGSYDFWGVLVFFLIFGGTLYYFWANKDRRSALLRYAPPVTDNPVITPAGPGKINVLSHVMLFENYWGDPVGKLVEPISEDSITSLLRKIKIETAARQTIKNTHFVLLDSIPAHWIHMDKRKKKLASAWVIERTLYMFDQWDSTKFIRVRK